MRLVALAAKLKMYPWRPTFVTSSPCGSTGDSSTGQLHLDLGPQARCSASKELCVTVVVKSITGLQNEAGRIFGSAQQSGQQRQWGPDLPPLAEDNWEIRVSDSQQTAQCLCTSTQAELSPL